MLNVSISDSKSSQNVSVAENKLIVAQDASPPLVLQKSRLFIQYLTDDGTSTGSNDMGIDGSTTNQTFYLSASATADRYITALNFLVGYGASAGLWKWADSAGALTNGSQLYYETLTETVYISEAIKTNSDLMRLSLNGNILPTAWELRHLGANNDYGYLFSINLKAFVPHYGVKLDIGTQEKIGFKIRDDVSDADTFNCVACGFDRLK